MKRSEMVAIIANEIEGYMNPSSAHRVADKLLKKLEKQGMLPPRHFKGNPLDMEEPHMPGYHGLNGWENEQK